LQVGPRNTATATGVSAAPAAINRWRLPNDATALARWLIGKTLVRQLGRTLASGRITETEAYLADDPASHGFKGPTLRNRSMFLRRGHAYVYRIYGVWLCLNVSAGKEGEGAAVLLRALEPVSGLKAMEKRRPGVLKRDLARGPGRLCQAFGVESAHDGLDLCQNNGVLWLAGPVRSVGEIGVSRRIGIVKAADLALRFYERGSAFVSGPSALSS
jgi:DNA-3-methyladenine glycosylase